MAKDAGGPRNETVWPALVHKGLARSDFPLAISLTYETNLRDETLIGTDH